MFSLLLPLIVISQFFSSTAACRDELDNVLDGASFDSYLPITLHSFQAWFYDSDNKPTCYNGRLNIKPPGSFHVIEASVEVTRHVDLSHAMVNLTIEKNDDDYMCRGGETDSSLMEPEYCRFPLVNVIPIEMIRVLEQPGIHDRNEFFNSGRFLSPLYQLPELGFVNGVVATIFSVAANYRVVAVVIVGDEVVAEIALPKGIEKVQVMM